MKTTFAALLALTFLLSSEKRTNADVPQLPISETWQYALALFDKLDSNGDGFLSPQELGQAVEKRDPEYTGQDAQVVAALYWRVELIMIVNHDESGNGLDHRGITKNDLTLLDNHASTGNQESIDALCTLRLLVDRGLYVIADVNENGYLSIKEFDDAFANNPNWKEKEKAAFGYFCKQQNTMNATTDGVSKEDIITHLTTSKDALIKYIEVKVDLVMWCTAESQKSNVVRTLYVDARHPFESIKPEAVKQGRIGDCTLEAIVAALSYDHSQLIVDMITDNNDGTYTVTFPGDKNNHVVVTAYTEAEMGLFNGGSEYGCWAGVIEKAFAKHRQMWTGHNSGYTQSEAALSTRDDGLCVDEVMPLLTGNGPFADYECPIEAASIQNALLKRHVITCSCNDKKIEYTQDDFYTDHLYSILAYDPNGPDGGTITLKNPHSHSDKQQISFKSFKSNFNQLYADNVGMTKRTWRSIWIIYFVWIIIYYCTFCAWSQNVRGMKNSKYLTIIWLVQAIGLCVYPAILPLPFINDPTAMVAIHIGIRIGGELFTIIPLYVVLIYVDLRRLKKDHAQNKAVPEVDSTNNSSPPNLS